MKVKEIMTVNVKVIESSDSIKKAAEEMRDHNIGFLPVKKRGEIAGVITDRDIVIRGIAEGVDISEIVEKIMTADIEWTSEEATVEQLIKQFEMKKIRRMPVRNSEGKLTGIVSLGDVAVKGDSILAEEALESISMPAEPVF